MFTTVERAVKQLGYVDGEEYDIDEIERMINSVTQAIKTYCRRDFKEFRLPNEEENDKQRLPYDLEDACLLWLKYRDRMNSSIGISSERIDGLGQKNYSLQHVDGKIIPAPPSVLALIYPYSELIYK